VEPVTWIVAIGIVAGGAYMLLPSCVPYLQVRSHSIYWILGIGLIVRIAFMMFDPVLEIDFYRYLWDGGVINAGYSPYKWSPDQVLSGEAPIELQNLASSAPAVVESINYPHLTTIYPPVAEAVFALSSWIKPWDLTVWRLIILAFELVTVGLLSCILRHINRSSVWIILYWWNPIVIFEFSNAAHMDAILLPFLIAALYFARKSRRPYASTICLAIGTAIKLWPVLLLPTFLRQHPQPRIFATVFVVFSSLVAILLWPFLAQAFHEGAGLKAYGVTWERNAALFHGGLGVLSAGLDSLGLYTLDAGKLVRACTGAIIILTALCINLQASLDTETLARRIIIVIAALLLLGPTMYPWYYTWMVPLLVIVPSRAMLAFSVVLPLYRLQFHPWFLDNPWYFTDIIVWLEQGPILILLCIEWRASRHRNIHGAEQTA
jgi:alpha-1,6-mannosyltransferase